MVSRRLLSFQASRVDKTVSNEKDYFFPSQSFLGEGYLCLKIPSTRLIVQNYIWPVTGKKIGSPGLAETHHDLRLWDWGLPLLKTKLCREGRLLT